VGNFLTPPNPWVKRVSRWQAVDTNS